MLRTLRAHWALLVLLALTGCAGANYSLHADSAQHPISLSGGLPDRAGNIYIVDHGLKDLGEFEYSTTKFAILYGHFPHREIDLSDAVNQQVKRHGGQGIVQLSVTTSQCLLNYVPIFTTLPIWPGCVVAVIKGRVVKLEVNAKADLLRNVDYPDQAPRRPKSKSRNSAAPAGQVRP